MNETIATKPSSEVAEATPEARPKPKAGTPVWVWVVYGLGALAATVFVASLAFVALASVTTGGGEAGVDVSMPALVVWLAFALAAFGTFVWRRWGRPKE